ncbi:MAG: DUF4097 family beta strand repeat-containing protein [Thermoplasmatota archaeon]
MILAASSILIGGALVATAVPGNVVALFGSHVDSLAATNGTGAPSDARVVHVWSGPVAAGITTGQLSVSSFAGGIEVMGWPEDAYQITVYAPQESATLGDGGIAATLQTSSTANSIQFDLKVTRTGLVDITTDPAGNGTSVGSSGPDPVGVVAFVPSDLLWTKVQTCSATSYHFGTSDLSSVFKGNKSDGACQSAVFPLTAHLSRSAMLGQGANDSAARFHVPYLLSNLTASDLSASTQYGSVTVANVQAQTASIATQYGAIATVGTFGTLSAASQYGAISASGAADTASLHSQYGSLSGSLAAMDSGSYSLSTQYGNVALSLVGGVDHGFDASGSTQYGHVTIDLQGATSSSDGNSTSAAPSTAASTLGAMIPAPAGSSYHYGSGEHKEVRSANYDGAAIKTTVNAATQYGNIVIRDA